MFGIIGASGFIGRSMADFLNARRIPYRAFLRRHDPAAHVHFESAESVQPCKIGHTESPGLFDGVDTLLIAAWATKPNTPGNSTEHEQRLNIQPQIRFLKALLKTDVQHLIFLSSGGAVYGQMDQVENVSEHCPCLPCTPYGYGKLQIENAIQKIWVAEGRRFTIIRPSNPVGRHQTLSVGEHGLFPSVVHAMIRGRPVYIFGNGRTVRDYFAVEDLVSLIWATNEKDLGNQIVNASSGKGLSIKNVVNLCSAATGIVPEIIHHQDKQPTIDYNVLCNRRAADVFGWSPQRPITEIARNLVNAVQAFDQGRGVKAGIQTPGPAILQRTNSLVIPEIGDHDTRPASFRTRRLPQNMDGSAA